MACTGDQLDRPDRSSKRVRRNARDDRYRTGHCGEHTENAQRVSIAYSIVLADRYLSISGAGETAG